MFVIGLLLVITQVSVSKVQLSKVSEQVMIQELIQEFKIAQQRAILTGQGVIISGRNQSQIIAFQDGDATQPYTRIILDDVIRLRHTFTLNYRSDGRIGSYQSIYFYNTQTGREFRLAIQLGNGQFEVQ